MALQTMPSRRVSQLKSAPDIRCPSADLQSPFVYFEVSRCDLPQPVLSQQAVTTRLLRAYSSRTPTVSTTSKTCTSIGFSNISCRLLNVSSRPGDSCQA